MSARNNAKKVEAKVSKARRDEILAKATERPHYYRSTQTALPDDDRPAVEPSKVQRKDSRGRVSAPMICYDTCAALERGKALSVAQVKAWRRFEEDYYKAGLDPQRAAQIDRLPGGHVGSVEPNINAANDRVRAALAALEGEQSPLGKVAIEVIGKGVTLRKFAEGQRRQHHRFIKGLIIGAAAVLALHYGLVPKAKR